MSARRLPRGGDKGFTAFVVVSVVLHALVLIGGRVWRPSETRVLPVYNVTLVSSVPGGGKRAEAPVAKGDPDGKLLAEQGKERPAPVPEPAAAKKAAPAETSAPAKKAAETRPVPKAVAKKSAEKPAKAKAADGGKAAASAGKAAKGKPAAKEESLTDALASVKGLYKGKVRGVAAGTEGAVRHEVGEFGAGSDGAQVGALAIQIYGGQIQAAIQRHWNIPGELAKRPLAVQLGIKVDPSGKLMDVWVDKGSGISVFDESALRAVRAAGDFPAPPQTKNGYFEIYTRFTPDGARSN
jgi:TolA protein